VWKRWNQNSHVWERSVDNGLNWTPLPMNAAVMNEGTLPAGRFPVWTDVPFNIANFWGALTWVIPGTGNIPVNRYVVFGKVMHWAINVNAFDLTGGPGIISITIPGGFRVASAGSIGMFTYYNGAGWLSGSVDVGAGATNISLTPLPSFQWVAANGNYLWINVTLPVQ